MNACSHFDLQRVPDKIFTKLGTYSTLSGRLFHHLVMVFRRLMFRDWPLLDPCILGYVLQLPRVLFQLTPYPVSVVTAVITFSRRNIVKNKRLFLKCFMSHLSARLQNLLWAWNNSVRQDTFCYRIEKVKIVTFNPGLPYYSRGYRMVPLWTRSVL